MTPEKQKQKLAGHTGIAQKAFQFTPISEDWTPNEIRNAMHQATGSRVDDRTLRGCLMTLADSGLVRVTASGTFQRIAVSSPSTQIMKKTEKVKPAMTTTTATANTEKTTSSAIDLLAGFAQKLRDMAAEVEAAALTIEEGQDKNAADVAKLHQLQALLKGLT